MNIAKREIQRSKKSFLAGKKSYIMIYNSFRVPLVTMRGYPKTAEESKNRIAKWQREFFSTISK